MAEKLADGPWSRFVAWLLPNNPPEIEVRWAARYGRTEGHPLRTFLWEHEEQFDVFDDAEHQLRCWIEDMTDVPYSDPCILPDRTYIRVSEFGWAFCIKRVQAA